MIKDNEGYGIKDFMGRKEITDSEEYRIVDLTDDKLAILKNYGVFIKVRNDTWLEILLGRDNVKEIYDELLGDRK